MPSEKPEHKAKRKLPLFTAEQKETIREEVLDLLKADQELYLDDLKNHLVRKYKIAKQTAYQWLRDWSLS